MKSAAMPAAEILDNRTDAPTYLKLVLPRDETPVHPRPVAAREEPQNAEDPDEMWDNMPV